MAKIQLLLARPGLVVSPVDAHAQFVQLGNDLVSDERRILPAFAEIAVVDEMGGPG